VVPLRGHYTIQSEKRQFSCFSRTFTINVLNDFPE
jgi:hypothetical protein